MTSKIKRPTSMKLGPDNMWDEDGEMAAYGEEQTCYGEDYDDCDGGQEDYSDKGECSY